MADIERLSRALKAAHAAGDTAAATKLAQAIRQQTQATPQTQDTPDTSLTGAVGQGVDQAGLMIGRGIESVGELTGSETIRNYGAQQASENQAQLDSSNYQRPEGADGIVSNLREGNLVNAGKSLVYGAAEAAPQVAGGVAASVGAGLAATTAPIVGTALAAGGTIYGVTSALGENKQEKMDKGLNAKANYTDLAAALASGVVELTPLKGGGATLKVIREALQEGVQEGLVIGNTAIQGGEYIPDEVINRLGDATLIGGTIAKAANTAISTVNKAGEVVFRPKEEVDPEVGQAAGDVARMMGDIAKQEGYNLKDIDPSSQKGANATLNAARSRVNVEIDAAAADLTKTIGKELDTATRVRLKDILKNAKNKVSTTVTSDDISFIKDNFGNTKEGQTLVQGLYKSNVVTEVYSAGLKGGISQFTDQFNPLPSFGRAYNPAGMIAGNLNTGAAIATGGSSLAAQIPLVVGGRAIDAVTGRRSKVNRFIQKNKGKEGLGAVGGTSLVEQARLRAAAAAQKKVDDAAARGQKQAEGQAKNEAGYVQSYQNGWDPNPSSPRGTVFTAISERHGPQKMSAAAIDAEVSRILDAAEIEYAGQQSTIDAIAQYRQMLATGRMSKEGKPLSTIAQLVATKWNPSEGTPPTGGPQPTGPTGDLPLTPARENGKRANQAYLATLRDKMDNDKTIRDEDRGVLEKAFDDLARPLGKDPVFMLNEIVDSASLSLMNPRLAETYLRPYVQRVKLQQRGQSGQDTPPPAPPQETPGPSGQGNTGVQGAEQGPSQAGPPVLAAPGPSGTPTNQVSGPQQTGQLPESGRLPKPNPKQVKTKIPEAKALIEIGKKGSKYENGIQNWDMALEAAKLLGQTVNIASSQNNLQEMGRRKGTSVGPNAVGFFFPNDGMTGMEGNVFAIKPNGGRGNKKRTPIEALTTLLHEIAHGITLGQIDGKSKIKRGMVNGARDYTSVAPNDLAKIGRETYPEGSFVGSAIVPLLGGKDFDPNNPIIKEVQGLQWNVEVYLKDNPSQKKKVRGLESFYKQRREKLGPAYAKRELANRRKYTNDFAEFAVDPVWVYMFDPKLAKELMPETTKLIQREFAKANNGKILFYTHPFATLLAVVTAMAGLAVAGGGGEDKEEQLPAGILTA